MEFNMNGIDNHPSCSNKVLQFHIASREACKATALATAAIAAFGAVCVIQGAILGLLTGGFFTTVGAAICTSKFFIAILCLSAGATALCYLATAVSLIALCVLRSRSDLQPIGTH